MKVAAIIALIWCIIPGQAWASSSNGSASQWLQSRVELSGASEKTNNEFNGHLKLNARSLFFADHVFGLKFQNGVSRIEGLDSDNLGFSYRLPVGDSRVGVEVLRRDHEGRTTTGGQRVNESFDKKAVAVSVSRPLFSWESIRFHSLIRHASEYEDRFEAGAWDQSVNEERTSLTLDASTRRELPAGFEARGRVALSAGSEFQRAEDANGADEDLVAFQKVSVSSSISRPVRNWTLGLGGHYQFAPTELPDSERVTVVSSSMISGFNGGSLSSAEGGWLKLNADSPRFSVPGSEGLKGRVQLAALRGWVTGSEVNSGQSGRASALEASLKVESRSVETNLSVGRMVESRGHSVDQPESPDFSLSVRVRL